ELRLEEEIDRLPQHLSLGMRQKVSILLAMIRPFRFLLADEPLNSLDPQARTVAAELIMNSAKRGCGVLVTTHDLSYASSFDRCVVLREGRVGSDDSPPVAGIARSAGSGPE